jgi:hypothetical protein
MMSEIEISYFNAYQLLTGSTNYDKLAENKVFYLPADHEDPEVVLRYYESVEDYEKCAKIVKQKLGSR